MWWDATKKYMKNVQPAFELFEGIKDDIPIGYQKIECHMIFDVQLGDNLLSEARFVVGGHKKVAPNSIIYSSILYCDSVLIALTIAALNGLDILACDIKNEYLTANCRENIWTIAEPDFVQ